MRELAGGSQPALEQLTRMAHVKENAVLMLGLGVVDLCVSTAMAALDESGGTVTVDDPSLLLALRLLSRLAETNESAASMAQGNVVDLLLRVLHICGFAGLRLNKKRSTGSGKKMKKMKKATMENETNEHSASAPSSPGACEALVQEEEERERQGREGQEEEEEDEDDEVEACDGEVEACKLAQAAITNLAGIKDTALTQELLDKGVVELSLDMSGRGRQETMRVNAVATLLNLANNVECARRIVSADGVPRCLHAVQDFHDQALFMALGTLKNLVDKLEPVAAILVESGVIPLAMEAYRNKTRTDTGMVALYLLRSFSVNELNVEALLEADVVALCLEIVRSEDALPKDRIFALQITEALCSHGSSPLRHIYEAGVADLCVRLTSSLKFVAAGSEEAEARTLAFSILYHMSLDVDVAAAMLLDSSVVDACSSASADNVTEIRAEALLVLQGLSRHREGHIQVQLARRGVIDLCVTIVKMDRSVVLLGTLAALDTLRNLSGCPENHPLLLQKDVLPLVQEIIDKNACGPEARAIAVELRRNLAGGPDCSSCSIL